MREAIHARSRFSRGLMRAGAVSCFTACIGDFVVTSLLSMLYPGYNFIEQSESLLSVSGSPVAHWVAAWSVVFTGLLVLFALGLQVAFGKTHRGITLLCWLVAIYGIGEGLISGLFPYDFVHGRLTVAGQIHAVGGIAGQAGLYFVPAVAWYALHGEHPGIKVLSVLVMVAGGVFLLLFGAAKLHLIGYRGLWQRLFMGVYFLYLMYLAWLTYRQAGKSQVRAST
ncbi:DUF998 domain-containing protein [Pontibacter mangrovi]|uniref:DUF998 domain-containing protein n=1 Tax=Pontibacter mangrovi TaxID=2589816 RepID=A0A501W3Q7_9BACT|nr:DUF998 domain-containing protein [Pontibacter mangrovi]